MTIHDYQILFLFFMLLLFSHLYILVKKGRQDLKGEAGLPSGKAMKPFLFLNLFYVNPDDPRSFLPKVNPALGWTINFRTKIQALLFALFLILVLVSAIGMARAALSQ